MNAAPLELDPHALQRALAQPSAPILVDVREAWEVRVCPFPGAVHIPLGALPSRALAELDPNRATVLVCHHGVRSLQGALVLRSAGFVDVRSLRGGTDLYSQTVDPTLPRY